MSFISAFELLLELFLDLSEVGEKVPLDRPEDWLWMRKRPTE
jgi:hypothetical protein